MSEQVKPPAPGETASITSNMTARHQELNLTGFLVFAGGSFVSVIEGVYETVISRLENLAQQSHHQRMIILREGAIKDRRFVGWISVDLSNGGRGLLSRNDAEEFATRLSAGLRRAI